MHAKESERFCMVFICDCFVEQGILKYVKNAWLMQSMLKESMPHNPARKAENGALLSGTLEFNSILSRCDFLCCSENICEPSIVFDYV